MTEHKVIYQRCLLIILVILAIYGAYTSGEKHKQSNDFNYLETNKDEIIPADKITFNNFDGDSNNTENEKYYDNISYDNFINLKLGSSYEEIKNVLGEGRKVCSNEISNVNTTIYEYEGRGISNITLTLQNGKLTSKTQLGLKPINSNITLDKYNMITKGMSYDEVINILGEGQLTTESSLMNNISCVYSYINEDGSNANFTFNYNGLNMKTQYNLK